MSCLQHSARVVPEMFTNVGMTKGEDDRILQFFCFLVVVSDGGGNDFWVEKVFIRRVRVCAILVEELVEVLVDGQDDVGVAWNWNHPIISPAKLWQQWASLPAPFTAFPVSLIESPSSNQVLPLKTPSSGNITSCTSRLASTDSTLTAVSKNIMLFISMKCRWISRK